MEAFEKLSSVSSCSPFKTGHNLGFWMSRMQTQIACILALVLGREESTLVAFVRRWLVGLSVGNQLFV